MLVFFVIVSVCFFVIVPDVSFAWGPAVHMGVSLSIIDALPAYIKMVLFANLNEYLYGALAPDFIVGKSLSSKGKHSHDWKIGFDILYKSASIREKAFAYGYLTHLSADAVAHSIMIRNTDEKFRGVKHTYMELVADFSCGSSYKELAKKVLSRYNADLDERFKSMVDSVLFSFSTSKFIFKGMVKVSLGRKGLERFLFNPRIVEFFAIDVSSIREYIELSKKFSVDVLLKGEDSPVLELSAVSE